MKSIYSMLAIMLMIIGLLVSINSFGQQVPAAVSGDGPVYNFNFYNKDSIPSSGPSSNQDSQKNIIPVEGNSTPNSDEQTGFGLARIGGTVSWTLAATQNLIGYDLGFKQRFDNGYSYSIKAPIGLSRYGVGVEKSFVLNEKSLFNWGISVGKQVHETTQGLVYQTYLGPEFNVWKFINLSFTIGLGRASITTPRYPRASVNDTYSKNVVNAGLVAFVNF